MEIQESKEVWIAWTNTELNEGRGHDIPKAVCDIEATAIRKGKKGSVQGNDCYISKGIAVRINNKWLVEGFIYKPSSEDIKIQAGIEKKRLAIKKAKDAGLSIEDLEALGCKGLDQ